MHVSHQIGSIIFIVKYENIYKFTPINFIGI